MKAKTGLAAATAVAAALLAFPADAQQTKKPSSQNPMDARAECFREANERVNSLGPSSSMGERSVDGASTYRDCARRKGIAP